MYKRTIIALFVAMSLSLLITGSGAFSGSSVWAAGPEPGVVVKLPSLEIVDTAQAQLVRNDNGAAVTIRTSMLTPGHAVTVWGFVWKNPGECEGSCGSDDFGIAMVRHVAGNIVGGSGMSTFSGNIDVWDGSEVPYDSEIHFVLVTHGSKDPGIIHEQLSTPNAGCGGPCPAVQGVAFFPAP
jgi:hypothetical protein